MTKSIESIWKEGFVEDMTSLAPKINDLYNQKSRNLVDRFELMFKVNQNSVLFGAAVIFAGLCYFNAPILGGVVGLMFCGLVVIGRQQLRSLKTINKDVSSFEYLQAFDQWLDKGIAQYVTVYRIFYPALFLICTTRFLYSDMAHSLLPIEDSGYNVAGMPLLFLLPVLFVTVILGFTGGALYQADVKLVYGRQIDKLKELISEMKQLRE